MMCSTFRLQKLKQVKDVIWPILVICNCFGSMKTEKFKKFRWLNCSLARFLARFFKISQIHYLKSDTFWILQAWSYFCEAPKHDFAALHFQVEMETCLNFKFKGNVLHLVPSRHDYTPCCVLFTDPFKDDLFLSWLLLVVYQSSCPFHRCECRLASNGSWSGLPSSNESNLMLKPTAAAAACSFGLTQPDRPLLHTRFHKVATGRAAEVCL